MKKVYRYIVAAIGAMLGLYVAHRVGLIGSVRKEKQRPWTAVNDTQIAVVNDEGKAEIVELPKGVKASEVKAVEISPKGEGENVKITHVVINRHNSGGDPEHDLSI